MERCCKQSDMGGGGILSSCIDLFEFPPQKQERKGVWEWEPTFASNLTLNFRVFIRPYWLGQVQSLVKDIQIDLLRRSRFTSTRRSIEPRQLLLCDCLIKSSCSLFLSIHLSHSITSYCCFLYGLPLLEASSYLFDFLLKYSLRNPQSLCLTRSYLEHQWTLQSTEVVCRLCGSRSLIWC